MKTGALLSVQLRRNTRCVRKLVRDLCGSCKTEKGKEGDVGGSDGKIETGSGEGVAEEGSEENGDGARGGS